MLWKFVLRSLLRLPRHELLRKEACPERTHIPKRRLLVFHPIKLVKPPATNGRATSQNALVESPDELPDLEGIKELDKQVKKETVK
jgi:hypothetical protein